MRPNLSHSTTPGMFPKADVEMIIAQQQQLGAVPKVRPLGANPQEWPCVQAAVTAAVAFNVLLGVHPAMV